MGTTNLPSHCSTTMTTPGHSRSGFCGAGWSICAMLTSDHTLPQGILFPFFRQPGGQRVGMAARDGNQGPRLVQIRYFPTPKTTSEARLPILPSRAAGGDRLGGLLPPQPWSASGIGAQVAPDVRARRKLKLRLGAEESTIEVSIPRVALQDRQRLGRERAQIGRNGIGLRVMLSAHPRNHGRDRGVRQAEA